MAQAVRFIALNEATYNGLPSGDINENAIYFATDSKKIYKGSSEQTQVAFHKASAQTYIPGKFYYQDQEVFFCNDLGELVSLTSVPYDDQVSDKNGDYSTGASTQAVYDIVEELKTAIAASFESVQMDMAEIQNYNTTVVTPAIMESKEFLNVTLPELSYTVSETVGGLEELGTKVDSLTGGFEDVSDILNNVYDKETVNQMISATSWGSEYVESKEELDAIFKAAIGSQGGIDQLIETYGSKFIWVPTPENGEEKEQSDLFDIYVLFLIGDEGLPVFEKIDSSNVDLSGYQTKEEFYDFWNNMMEGFSIELYTEQIQYLEGKIADSEAEIASLKAEVAANVMVWETL